MSDLFDKICSIDNFVLAYQLARKGKRFRRDTLQYHRNWEESVVDLLQNVIDGSWRPNKLRTFVVYEPKRRDIQAPKYEDRIVHNAICNFLVPMYERRFIYHSYACRVGKGTHAAITALQKNIRYMSKKYLQPYVVQCDISKYFASIDHEILLSSVRNYIKCDKTSELITHLVTAYGDGNKGLPIGALTSQLFANVMLDNLDHRLIDLHRMPFYIRYMDDFITILPDKNCARDAFSIIRDEVARLKLVINPKSAIYPMKKGVDFCGYRTWATHILPRKRNVKKFYKKLKRLEAMYIDDVSNIRYIRHRLVSFLGYSKHCNMYDKLYYIYEKFPFLYDVMDFNDVLELNGGGGGSCAQYTRR